MFAGFQVALIFLTLILSFEFNTPQLFFQVLWFLSINIREHLITLKIYLVSPFQVMLEEDLFRIYHYFFHEEIVIPCYRIAVLPHLKSFYIRWWCFHIKLQQPKVLHLIFLKIDTTASAYPFPLQVYRHLSLTDVLRLEFYHLSYFI